MITPTEILAQISRHYAEPLDATQDAAEDLNRKHAAFMRNVTKLLEITVSRLMKVVIEDKSKSIKDLHNLEKQINKMSIEVIDLKLSQGVPHGI